MRGISPPAGQYERIHTLNRIHFNAERFDQRLVVDDPTLEYAISILERMNNIDQNFLFIYHDDEILRIVGGNQGRVRVSYTKSIGTAYYFMGQIVDPAYWGSEETIEICTGSVADTDEHPLFMTISIEMLKPLVAWFWTHGDIPAGYFWTR